MEELRIRQVIAETVQETLAGLGFDTAQIHETQADMAYLRRVRRGSEEVVGKLRISLATLMLSTALILIWQAVRDIFKG